MQICCSICKEIFIANSHISVTKCGHLYHEACISTWYTNRTTCPDCRASMREKPFRIYLNIDSLTDEEQDTSTLLYRNATLSSELQEKEREAKGLGEKIRQYENNQISQNQHIRALESEISDHKQSIRCYKTQMKTLEKTISSHSEKDKEFKLLQSRVNELERVDKLIRGSEEEINVLFNKTPVTESSIRNLSTYVQVLKQQLKKKETRHLKDTHTINDLQKAFRDASKSQEVLKTRNETLFCRIQHLEEEIKALKKSLSECKENEKGYNAKSPSLMRRPVKRSAVEYSDSSETDSPGLFNFSCHPAKVRANEKAHFNFNLNTKIVNNLERKTKKNLDIEVVPGPSTLSFKPRSIAPSSSIFKKAPPLVDKEFMSNFVSDGLGGSKKISLATPTPRDELLSCFQNKLKSKAKPRKETVVNGVRKLDDFFS